MKPDRPATGRIGSRDCIVVAPSLIPHKPGDRVKPIDAVELKLARQLCARRI